MFDFPYFFPSSNPFFRIILHVFFHVEGFGESAPTSKSFRSDRYRKLPKTLICVHKSYACYSCILHALGGLLAASCSSLAPVNSDGRLSRCRMHRRTDRNAARTRRYRVSPEHYFVKIVLCNKILVARFERAKLSGAFAQFSKQMQHILTDAVFCDTVDQTSRLSNGEHSALGVVFHNGNFLFKIKKSCRNDRTLPKYKKPLIITTAYNSILTHFE